MGGQEGDMPTSIHRIVIAGVLGVASAAAGQMVGPPSEVAPTVHEPAYANPLPGADRTLPATGRHEAMMPLSGGGIKAGVGDTGMTDAAPGGGLGRTLGALAGVVGLIVILAGLVRRIAKARGGLSAMIGAGGRAPSGVVFVLGRYPIGRGQTLILLKVERRVLLISRSQARGISASGMTTLAEITDPDEVASIVMKMREVDEESISGRFRSMLGRFDTAHTAAERDPVRRARRTPVTPTAWGGASVRGDVQPTQPPRPAMATSAVKHADSSSTSSARADSAVAAPSRVRAGGMDRATEALRTRLAAARNVGGGAR